MLTISFRFKYDCFNENAASQRFQVRFYLMRSMYVVDIYYYYYEFCCCCFGRCRRLLFSDISQFCCFYAHFDKMSLNFLLAYLLTHSQSAYNAYINEWNCVRIDLDLTLVFTLCFLGWLDKNK